MGLGVYDVRPQCLRGDTTLRGFRRRDFRIGYSGLLEVLAEDTDQHHYLLLNSQCHHTPYTDWNTSYDL